MVESHEDSDVAYSIAAYLRIASLAISLYDYLETMPTALRFYREQTRSRRITLSCILFVAIRATSIMVLTISNVGFFYNHFTIETCKAFFLLPPTFKVLQAMVSQAILGIRAWNLSRRSRKITYLLIALYVSSCILQWVTTLIQRSPWLGSQDNHHNCRAYNAVKIYRVGAYIYYAVAVTYDFATTAISIFYLLKYKMTSNNSMMTKVTRMMLYDGIGYFIALAGVNVLNLILFREAQSVQTAASSLAYSVSWIMSQRLLIHLYDASRERRSETIEEAITITQHLDNARQVSHIIRSQFEPKSDPTFDLTVPEFNLGTEYEHEDAPEEFEVQVRVEHTVKLDRRLRTYELENYSRNERCSQDMHSRHR